MDFASNLIKEQQVVRLLKDYCETPRSFEQIEHFLAQECSFDPDEMRARIKVVLRLIDRHYLVSAQTDRWRFSLPQEGWASILGADATEADERTPVTLAQFRTFLHFVSVFYELSHNQLSYSAQEEMVTAQGKVKPSAAEYSLVARLNLSDAPAQGPNNMGQGHIKMAQAQLEVANSEFVRLNLDTISKEADSRLFLGWPILVTGQGEERCYTPIFYFALTKAQMDASGAIASSQVIGPFYNEDTFEAQAKSLFDRKVLEGFAGQVYDKLKKPSAVSSALAPLSTLVRTFFWEHCYGSEFAFDNISSLVGPSEIEHCDNKIVFAATIAVSQPRNYDKSTLKDLKRIADASDHELMQSALSCFFVDERSAQVRADAEDQDTKQQASEEAPGFNPFDVASCAALVFNFDPSCPCDEDQAQAVRSMLKNDLTLLQGPPGTGKTMTVVSAAYNHVVRGQKVLVTSFNNAAIDAFYEKALLKISDQDGRTHNYRLAKLLKAPTSNSALKFKQLAKELAARPKALSADFMTFADFRDKVAQQEQLVAALEQLREQAEFDFNLLQTKVDDLVQRFIYRYCSSLAHMPAPARKFFAQLFTLNYEVLAMAPSEQADKVYDLSNQSSLTFNVRFSPDHAQQQAFMDQLAELEHLIDSYQGNAPDDSNTFQQLGFIKRWWVVRTNQMLRYCDHKMLKDLIQSVRKLSQLKAQLVQSKARYDLAYPNLPELDTESLETTIKHFALTTSSASINTDPEFVRVVDNSVKHVLAQLSTKLITTEETSGNMSATGTATLEQPPQCVSLEAKGLLSNIVRMVDADEQLERHIDLVLEHFPVCTTSLLSVGTSLPCHSAMFDLVIFDEAAQFNFIAALPLLFRAKRAAIIGDPQQLQPVGGYAQAAIDQTSFVYNLSNKLRTRFNLNHTLYDFAHYCFAHHTPEQGQQAGLPELILRQNRRSVANIVTYISQSFYQGQLAASRKVIAQELANRNQLLDSFDLGFNFIAVPDSMPEPRKSSRFCPQEVAQTIELIRTLAQESYRGKIGVIAPYRAHVDELNAQLRALPESAHLDLEIDTVHRFQGKDCDTIIYNLCLSPSSQREFATDLHIINVALSRARDYLFVVGNPSALLLRSHIPYLAALQSKDELMAQGARVQDLMLAQARLASYATRSARFDTVWEHMLYQAIKQSMEQDPYFASVKVGLYTQLPMLHYRLDLALVYQDIGLDIECDGSQHYVYWLDEHNCQEVPSDQQRAQHLAELKPITFATIRFRNCLIEQDTMACAHKAIARFKELIAERRSAAQGSS